MVHMPKFRHGLRMLMMRRGAVRRVGLDRVVASCLVVASLAVGCGGAELPRETEEATAPQGTEPVPAEDVPPPTAESVAGESASEDAPTNTPIPPPPLYVPDPSGQRLRRGWSTYLVATASSRRRGTAPPSRAASGPSSLPLVSTCLLPAETRLA